MESGMVSAAVKMTGLDLGSSHRSSEELLSTPKLLPSSAGLVSPRFSAHSISEDMLTTPVLTTPKSEYWMSSSIPVECKKTEGRSSQVIVPTDISLRSPCDGLLHKRRMYKHYKRNSIHSADSCDNSEYSPRDLSTGRISPNIVVKKESGTPPPSALSLLRESSSIIRLSKSDHHYTPSPLAVPSPNWNVVERYMGGSIGGEILKTPKLLDNSFFDFLPQPTTPKSKVRELSPKLSPRFPIPEVPTDLSKNSSQKIPEDPPPPPYPSEAEDLSMSTKCKVEEAPRIKTEELEYRSTFPPQFYLPPQFLYSRQIYSELQQRNESENYESSNYSNYSLPNQSSWNTPESMEDSSSPPSGYSNKGLSVKPSSLLLRDPIEDKNNKPKRKSKSVKVAGKPKDDSAKRVYTCPHCQRSYDWNYNLNRHLKYECGKENAFQCAKCGRKFPHKQNCVYHLKRKHKIICDGIDQYVSKGLVLFRGNQTSNS